MDERALAAALVAREGRSAPPFGLYVVPAADPAAELGRALERRVFDEVFGNSPELLDAEYRPYDPASVFLLVVDHRAAAVAGVIRLLLPSPVGLKTLHDAERLWAVRLGDHPEGAALLAAGPMWDVATLAVAPGYRRRETDSVVSAALFQAVVRLGRAHGCRAAVATLDCAVLDMIQALLGRPFVPFPGAEPLRYLDSPASLPVYADVPGYRRRLAAADAATHAFLFEGTGLEASVSTPDWSLVRVGPARPEGAAATTA